MRAAPLPFLLALLSLFAAALPSMADAPAPAAQAFGLEAARDAAGGLRLTWTIAPGTYLYRSRLKAATADGTAVPLATPPGETEDDPTFGPTEIYRGGVTATVAAADVPAAGPIAVTYQGCAERGLCYPPQTRQIDPRMLAAMAATGSATAPQPEATAGIEAPPPAPSAPGVAAVPALTGALGPMLATFLGLGVLLAFTPCVFPMIPILSGILTRSAAPLTAARGFALSTSYAVAAALAYAALGVVAAWSGQNLQAVLQTPAVLGALELVFVLLAFSSFGLFELQLPSAWTTRVSTLPGLRGGSLGGAAALGFASALVVGPCVTPPLAAALLYVAQGGNVWRGALALFAMGLGMGLPLIAIGTFGAGLLPRAGAWMVVVRQAFGVVFLGVAIMLASRIVPGPVTLLVWALLATGVGAALGGPVARLREGWPGVLHRMGSVSATAYGLLLLVGVAGGASDPLRPLGFLTSGPSAMSSGDFTSITTPSALDQALAAAHADRRPVLLDFAAAWCTSCRAIDGTLRTDESVQRRLAGFRVVRADVTSNDADTRALLARYGVLGMPTLVFLSGRDGAEVPQTRLVGEAEPAALIRSLDRAATRS